MSEERTAREKSLEKALIYKCEQLLDAEALAQLSQEALKEISSSVIVGRPFSRQGRQLAMWRRIARKAIADPSHHV